MISSCFQRATLHSRPVTAREIKQSSISSSVALLILFLEGGVIVNESPADNGSFRPGAIGITGGEPLDGLREFCLRNIPLRWLKCEPSVAQGRRDQWISRPQACRVPGVPRTTHTPLLVPYLIKTVYLTREQRIVGVIDATYLSVCKGPGSIIATTVSCAET